MILTINLCFVIFTVTIVIIAQLPRATGIIHVYDMSDSDNDVIVSKQIETQVMIH